MCDINPWPSCISHTLFYYPSAYGFLCRRALELQELQLRALELLLIQPAPACERLRLARRAHALLEARLVSPSSWRSVRTVSSVSGVKRAQQTDYLRDRRERWQERLETRVARVRRRPAHRNWSRRSDVLIKPIDNTFQQFKLVAKTTCRVRH